MKKITIVRLNKHNYIEQYSKDTHIVYSSCSVGSFKSVNKVNPIKEYRKNQYLNYPHKFTMVFDDKGLEQVISKLEMWKLIV